MLSDLGGMINLLERKKTHVAVANSYYSVVTLRHGDIVLQSSYPKIEFNVVFTFS